MPENTSPKLPYTLAASFMEGRCFEVAAGILILWVITWTSLPVFCL